MPNIVACLCHCCFICGRWYNHFVMNLTDVTVNVADGKPLNDVMADVIVFVADRLTTMLYG